MFRLTIGFSVGCVVGWWGCFLMGLLAKYGDTRRERPAPGSVQPRMNLSVLEWTNERTTP